MSDQFDSELIAMLRAHEGVVPHLYLDSRGNVTAGAGHLCSTSAEACRLPFYRAAPWRLATSSEISFGWACLKYQQAGVPKKLQVYTNLLLEDDDINAILLGDADEALDKAKADFPEFDSYPLPARLAIADMLYNLGSLKEFPALTTAIHARDWSAAATQCARRGVGEQRNIDTQNYFTQASKTWPIA